MEQISVEFGSKYNFRNCRLQSGGHFTSASMCQYVLQLGLYSLSGKKSYHKISWSLKAVGLDVVMIISFWNLTGKSAAQISERLEKSNPESRGFESSQDLSVRRLTAYWIEVMGFMYAPR